MYFITKHMIRLPCLIRWLPNVGTIVVFQFSELCQCSIIHDEGSTFTIRTLQAIDQIKHIVRLDACRQRIQKMSTMSGIEDTCRFSCTISIQECIFFCICQCLAKLGDDVTFQIERIVIQQFFCHLDCHMELVCIHDLLVKGCITKSQCSSLINPCCCRFGCCNVDLVFPGSCDHSSKTTHDILLFQNLDQSAVVLNRNQITAVGIHTFLQDIGHLTEIGTHGSEHGLSVFIRSTSGFLFRVSSCCIWFSCQRRINRLGQFCFPLLYPLGTRDRICQSIELCFHVHVSCCIIFGQSPLLILMCIKEISHLTKQIGTFLHHFSNSHNNPLIFFKKLPKKKLK